MANDVAVRPPTLIDFGAQAAQPQAGVVCHRARGQNFEVTLLQADPGPGTFETESGDELMLIVLHAAVSVTGPAETAVAEPRTVAILPAGRWQLGLAPGAHCTVLRSLRAEPGDGCLNAADYADPDPRITPVGTPWRPLQGRERIRMLAIDAVQASKDRPRLKMLQSATLSINWVEYDGPRQRQALSPHSHGSFEQGSLALAGTFVHHLRVPWGENADLWQDDRHARLGSPSLLVVPVGLVHTSEGVGPGAHLLIDVFSPPRADFIEKGWVFNAGDYAAPSP